MKKINSDELLNELGVKIAFYRKSLDLSQEELSTLLDISVPQMSNIERGLATVNVKQLLKLSKIFDLSPNDLIYSNIDYCVSGDKAIEEILIYASNILNIKSEKDKKLLKDVLQYFNSK